VTLVLSVVLAVVDVYWPHRPGPRYLNPGTQNHIQFSVHLLFSN
jgi:hypothetical protein